MTTERKESVRLTVPEQSDLWTVLKERCRQVGGMAVYEAGWSDEKVAEAVERAEASHVARLRLQHFGKLAAAGMGEEVDGLEKRLELLTQTVFELTARVVALEEARERDAGAVAA